MHFAFAQILVTDNVSYKTEITATVFMFNNDGFENLCKPSIFFSKLQMREFTINFPTTFKAEIFLYVPNKKGLSTYCFKLF